MIATPIPRTLAMTLYADLDVSTLDELPPGRTPVDDRAAREHRAATRFCAFVRSQVERRAAGLLGLSADRGIGEAGPQGRDRRCTSSYRPALPGEMRVALLHGRMPSEQRESDHAPFSRRRDRLLVATTVIEVGVDVAERVADGHRARGAVRPVAAAPAARPRRSRRAKASYCILLGDAGEDVKAAARGMFASTDDGFEIARADLRIRGMGDLFGEQQSGEAMLRMADLVRDEKLNDSRRRRQRKRSRRIPGLEKAQNAGLKRALSARFPRALELFRVG